MTMNKLVWRLLCSDFLSNLATSLAAKIISLWFVLAVFGEERSVPWVSGFLTVIAVASCSPDCSRVRCRTATTR